MYGVFTDGVYGLPDPYYTSSMPLETVRIQVVDHTVAQEPVSGAGVRVFDVSGTQLEAWEVTDSQGIADFTLVGDDPPVEYQVRFFKQGASFGPPKLISVYSPPAVSPSGGNDFRVVATIPEIDPPANPLVCRAHGVVFRPDGRPHGAVDMHFIPTFRPSSVGGALVVGERVATRTDSSGHATVDLYRHGIYDVTIEGHEHELIRVVVPDLPTVNLADLILPTVARIDWDPVPSPAWEVPAGDELIVEPTVWTSSGVRLRQAGTPDVEFCVEDVSIASVKLDGDRVHIRGISPGTTKLVAQRANGTLVHIPDAGIINGVVDLVIT